ncbi:hypothetical protein [Methanosarcina barkeri]|uniref:hypothetical protein n=1 Tax=Methanosarcina barkeri TaxID=2208 RepID=UPI000A741B5C|nr:hypothetical protein [Methanosarcina barkeri]
MANVIIMRVPKDKLQQEIEYKVLDGWKLRKKNENIAVLTRPSEWENLLISVALALLTLESLYIIYRWVKGKKNYEI